MNCWYIQQNQSRDVNVFTALFVTKTIPAQMTESTRTEIYGQHPGARQVGSVLFPRELTPKDRLPGKTAGPNQKVLDSARELFRQLITKWTFSSYAIVHQLITDRDSGITVIFYTVICVSEAMQNNTMAWIIIQDNQIELLWPLVAVIYMTSIVCHIGTVIIGHEMSATGLTCTARGDNCRACEIELALELQVGSEWWTKACLLYTSPSPRDRG